MGMRTVSSLRPSPALGSKYTERANRAQTRRRPTGREDRDPERGDTTPGCLSWREEDLNR